MTAGMACEGLKPFVAIYSTFMQRAYDQAIHDIAIQNLPVRLIMDTGETEWKRVMMMKQSENGFFVWLR